MWVKSKLHSLLGHTLGADRVFKIIVNFSDAKAVKTRSEASVFVNSCNISCFMNN